MQLGHTYPNPGAPLSGQVIVDLSENPQELTAAEGDVYPLIFRLETISDKGLADGHVLEVLTHILMYTASKSSAQCCMSCSAKVQVVQSVCCS